MTSKGVDHPAKLRLLKMLLQREPFRQLSEALHEWKSLADWRLDHHLAALGHSEGCQDAYDPFQILVVLEEDMIWILLGNRILLRRPGYRDILPLFLGVHTLRCWLRLWLRLALGLALGFALGLGLHLLWLLLVFRPFLLLICRLCRLLFIHPLLQKFRQHSDDTRLPFRQLLPEATFEGHQESADLHHFEVCLCCEGLGELLELLIRHVHHLRMLEDVMLQSRCIQGDHPLGDGPGISTLHGVSGGHNCTWGFVPRRLHPEKLWRARNLPRCGRDVSAFFEKSGNCIRNLLLRLLRFGCLGIGLHQLRLLCFGCFGFGLDELRLRFWWIGLCLLRKLLLRFGCLGFGLRRLCLLCLGCFGFGLLGLRLCLAGFALGLPRLRLSLGCLGFGLKCLGLRCFRSFGVGLG
mmetsp:Transcript_20283/g.47695  ORF Transcript_20283/g.47695 Transcript_20283/m.47695 type:complete len:408 (+) Transcript_20283:181-1404(+)